MCQLETVLNMENFRIVKYSSIYYQEWNDFVSKAKNATFLFNRNFMDYHKDRFEDFSLLIYKKNKLIAVFPANKLGDDIFSHQGLTYGGLILLENVKFNVVIEVFQELLKFLNKDGFVNLVLKQMPLIYNTVFTEEIQYLMYILKAELIKRDALSTVNLQNKLKISSNRLEGFRRGKKHHLVVKEEDSFELFWDNILIKNLNKKYNANPVHSLKEITALKKSFPNDIRQFNVYKDDKLVAGTTVFESKHVAHSQYISADENKNEFGSLDYLHVHLIENVFKNKKYFDFGISNENDGLNINKGLQYWKEGFGARTVIQDFYRIETKNHKLLESVML